MIRGSQPALGGHEHESLLRAYLRDVRRNPLLDRAQERAMGRRIQEAHIDARRALLAAPLASGVLFDLVPPPPGRPIRATPGWREHARSRQDVRRTRQIVARLPCGEESIIPQRFGIGEPSALTSREIGAVHGICRERVRQIESMCLEQLRADAPLSWLRDPATVARRLERRR